MLESKKADYRSIQKSKPLDIPPELTAPAKDDRYTVSEANSKGTTFSNYSAERAAVKSTSMQVDPEAKAVPVLQQSDKLRIERAGNQRWLVMQGTPDKAWLLVKSFVQARGLSIKVELPEAGLLETDWAEKAVYVPQEGIRGQLARALGTLYSTGERDKYRFRLEAGHEAGTTDVFVSHRGVEEVYVTERKDETRWQPRASDPDLEIEMLGRLIQHLGVDDKKTAAILAPTAVVVAGDRARLVESGSKLYVDLDERFDRAWRRVGLALDRNGFTVEDRDRAKGLFFVRYNDPLADKKAAAKGWLDSLAFWREDPTVDDSAQSSFRIVVQGTGEELSRVEVQDKAGGSLTTPGARKILEIVRSELK